MRTYSLITPENRHLIDQLVQSGCSHFYRDDPRTISAVLQKDEQPISYVVFTVQNAIAILEYLFTHPQFRQRGNASSLLLWGIGNLCNQHQCTQIVVKQNNDEILPLLIDLTFKKLGQQLVLNLNPRQIALLRQAIIDHAIPQESRCNISYTTALNPVTVWVQARPPRLIRCDKFALMNMYLRNPRSLSHVGWQQILGRDQQFSGINPDAILHAQLESGDDDARLNAFQLAFPELTDNHLIVKKSRELLQWFYDKDLTQASAAYFALFIRPAKQFGLYIPLTSFWVILIIATVDSWMLNKTVFKSMQNYCGSNQQSTHAAALSAMNTMDKISDIYTDLFALSFYLILALSAW